MKVTIPSTTVKSGFLKTIPIGTIYIDPRNDYKYQVQERRINTSMTKAGVAYFGQQDGITIEVPETMMKIANPKRCNIMTTMKDKLNKLEALNSELIAKLNLNSKLDEIKKLLGQEKYYETETELYFISEDNMIYLVKKVGSKRDSNQLLSEYKDQISKDSRKHEKLINIQPKLQSKLLKLLREQKLI